MNREQYARDKEARLVELKENLEQLTNLENQELYILNRNCYGMPCPVCDRRVSKFEGALFGDDSTSPDHQCPHCSIELRFCVPFIVQPGSPGWHWRISDAGQERLQALLLNADTAGAQRG